MEREPCSYWRKVGRRWNGSHSHHCSSSHSWAVAACSVDWLVGRVTCLGSSTQTQEEKMIRRMILGSVLLLVGLLAMRADAESTTWSASSNACVPAISTIDANTMEINAG